ncbi:unnamed protein product [Candidula unifasciata]|uniref:SOCS box domain-containing protein n=1 Tax=Candidula unifasciata TaxID=100452 RepID=A0A8S3ZCB7_9EUPU|nr:unnamed protein product [Candidula unifasciata]
MENIDWEHIHFNELDTILRINSQDTSVIDEEVGKSTTPLCLACKFKREDLLTVLLFHRARTDKRSSNGKLPLHYACNHASGNRGMVRKLLEAKAEIDARDSSGNTSLHLACKQANIPVVELLIENGATVNLGDRNGETPLVVACYSFSTDLVNVLLKAGSDPNVLGGCPVQVAVGYSSPALLNLLIAAGAHLTGRGYLSLACVYGHFSIIKTLLESGADVNELNFMNMTPLHSALYAPQSSTNIARLLLRSGANIHAAPLLHLACDKSDTAKIKLLLAYGADANVRDHLGCSPLIKLVDFFQNGLLEPKKRHLQTMRLLIAAGSKLSQGHLSGTNMTNWLTEPMSVELKATLELLVYMAANPPDLQFQCRIVIRRSIPPNKDEHIVELPLPPKIIRYLTFDEIE